MDFPGGLDFYKSILEHLQGDVVVLDENGRYVYVNKYAVDDPELRRWIIGRTIMEYSKKRGYHPDVTRNRCMQFDRVISERKAVEWEECLDEGNGRLRFYSRRLFPILSDQGQVSYLIIHGIDITTLREKEHMLIESERRLSEAQLLSKTGNYRLNMESGQIVWSPGMYEIFGMDPSLAPELKLFYDFLHPEDRPVVEATAAAMRVGDAPWTIQYRIVLPSGEIRWVEAHSKIEFDMASGTHLLVGSCQNVTERETLLLNLREKESELQESLKAKESFLANISHELRTPLNGILGIVRLLRRTQLNGVQREYIEVMSETAGNLLYIINDLLDFARWQSGVFAFEESVFDPVKVAESTLQLQVFRAQEKGLRIHMNHDGNTDTPLVKGDPHRLSQVLLNLISNAVKFTEQGEVVLNYSVIYEDRESIRIRFSVQDTGIGIPPEMHKRIFDSFTQVSSAAGFGTGGLGLGLAISKTLVERQGGVIHVESTPGHGSEFSIELQYTKAGKGEKSVLADAGIAPDLSSIRVLVADDNKVNLFVTEAMLESWNMQVETVHSGKEAVDHVVDGMYDLILMDLQMPGMDGVEATRRIRALTDPSKCRIPILAVTANNSRATRRMCLAAGMDDCLVKPFKEEVLFRKIASLVGSQRTRQSYRPARRIPSVKGVDGVLRHPLYDLTKIQSGSTMNPEFLKRMLGIFNETVPPAVDEMLERHRMGDLISVSSLAHKIRPTLDGSGITALKETIRDIEHYAERNRTPEQLNADLIKLHEVIQAVSRQFVSELERMANSG